jgi:hypothetical protein
MTSLSNIIEIIKELKITTIIYDTRGEVYKDLLLKKINYIELQPYVDNINIKQYIRDLKINSLLEDVLLSNRFLFDLSKIKYKNDDFLSRPKVIRNVCQKLQEEIYNVQYGLILTAQGHNSINSIGDTNMTPLGGNTPIFISDLVLSIQGDSLKIIKNRGGGENITISLNELYEDFK